MKELFREHAINIRIFYGKETETDPFEHTVELTELPSLPIKAIVTDLTTTQAAYKMIGIQINKAKEIIIEKKFESFLLLSQKIKIGDTYYKGWKVNGQLQYRIEENYLRAYVYSGK